MPQVILTSNTETISKKYAEYLRYNLRDINELALRKTKSLAISLWMYTPKANPADIKAKVQSLGWRVIRPNNQKMQELIAKFGGGNAAVRSGRRGGFKRITLADMQRVITGLRIRRVGGIAGGWLEAARQAKGPESVPNGRRGRGYVKVTRQGNVITVIVANGMPGAIALQDKHDYVSLAFKREIADIDEYISRKQRERASIFNPSGARAA